tara:strand:- start:3160 stop:3369 length:210 start_codon:yes stop_codon:yes gene_type:complete
MKIKIISIMFFTLILGCSLDTKSEFWNNKADEILRNAKKINISEKLTYEQFKKQFIDYGIKSDFPNIED